MRKLTLLTFLFCLSFFGFGQKKNNKIAPLPEKPKLVIGIVVDQMRYDFLYRFSEKYSDGGFKRLMNEGFNCRNNQYQYATTVTGPGHAHVYSGSVPAVSGIVGNDWYDRSTGKTMYVAADSTVKLVGEGNEATGRMSPRNMLVTTITDQLRLSNEFQSKVIGVSIKDRGAILPAGHTGKAYWYESKNGNFVSSTYYHTELPTWVNDFNNQKLAQKYANLGWSPLYDIATYTETEADEQPYENNISGEKTPVFPHKVTASGLAMSPYGNTIVSDFAKKAIEAEALGKGNATDFLAISYSTPDYVGHSFGPHSKEIEDIYLRLDLEIKDLLTHLDATVGKNQYVVFLTADHGVADIPAYSRKNNIPAGFFTGSEIQNEVTKQLTTAFGEGKWLLSEDNYQLYLNHDLLKTRNLTSKDVLNVLRPAFLKMEGIYDIFDWQDIQQKAIPAIYKEKLVAMYNPKRSGDLMILPEPAWFIGYTKGTTHGTMWAYDTHVPLLWYGWKIPKGETVEPTYIADIAPTLAILLKILEPNGCVGKPIEDLFD